MAELRGKEPPTYYRKEAGGNPGGTVLSRRQPFNRKDARIPFSLLLFYLLLEYGRPQDQIPYLSALHLPAITIVLLLLSVLFSGKFRIKGTQMFLFLGLLGLMVVHGPIAVNNYWALMIFITMTINFIVFLSLTLFVDNQEKYEKLIKMWLAIHVLLAVIGIVKGSGRGIGGFLGDENDFCMTMNMIIPFPFFLALSEVGKKRILYLGLTLIFLTVIILTQSRGGFVGLLATIFYCWLRTKKKVLTALLIAILAGFVLLIAPSSYWSEVRSIQEEGASKGTGGERVYTWGIGWHMFLDNPIIGVGQGNFPWVFKKYELQVTGSDEPFRGRSVAGRMAHSIYFTLLPELGLIGTILFLGMVAKNIKDLNFIKKNLARKAKPPGSLSDSKWYHLALALEGSMIAYLVSGAFISILYYPNFWIFTGFVISLKLIVSRDGEKSPEIVGKYSTKRVFYST
jgi:O-antigen ligase